MKFLYPEIETTNEFNLRWYHINEHKAYPSITSMLSLTESLEKRQSLEKWAKSIGEEEANRITEEAAENGTLTHLLLEYKLQNKEIDFSKFSEQSIKNFKSLKFKVKNINEVWGQEVALFSDKLKIAGRCDCVGVFKGVPSIIDFKTSRKIKDDQKIENYKYQLAFYAQAHNEMFQTEITNGVILMSTNDGLPLEFNVDLNKYFDKLHHRISYFYEIIFKE